MKNDIVNEKTSLLDKDNRDEEHHISHSKNINQEEEFDLSKTLTQAFYEFVATFMFMSIIYYCNGDVTKFIFGFWIILCIFGKLSGAHVNPAITLGFYFYEQKWQNGLYKLFLYWIAQFLGATFGALFTKQFFTDLVYVGVPTTMKASSVIYSEFFFTGTFLFVILWVCSEVTDPSYSIKNKMSLVPLNCGLIVSWFYMIVQAGSKLSGAAYNPAILFVLNDIAYQIKDSTAMEYVGYMILSELFGAMVFAYIFKYCFEPFYEAVHGRSHPKPNEKA